MPDSLRAYAESVSQFKAAQKREEQRRLTIQDQSESYEANHLAGRGRYSDYDFHNSVRRSGAGLNGNDTMPDSVQKLDEIRQNSLGNLESAESSHTEEEKDYDYEYDYEEEVSDNDKEEEDGEKSDDEGPEYYYYYYYEYPDEGIDISHEMDAEPIYEPLPTPLWQTGEEHINSTDAETAEKSESISESEKSVSLRK